MSPAQQLINAQDAYVLEVLPVLRAARKLASALSVLEALDVRCELQLAGATTSTLDQALTEICPAWRDALADADHLDLLSDLMAMAERRTRELFGAEGGAQ